MKETLEKMKKLLKQAGKEKTIQPPTTKEDISEWENQNNTLIPDEIKEFLLFSDGFIYGWGTLVIYALRDIEFVKDWDSVPDGWLNLGSIIGDGAELVSDRKGTLFLADHENYNDPLCEFSLKSWIEEQVCVRIEEDMI